MGRPIRTALRRVLQLLGLLALCTLALQLFFVLRIALMAAVDPQSTSFQRSEMARLLIEKQRIAWSQTWVDGSRISPHLKRAVIASEDAGFTEHGGIDWDAIERAWERNQQAEARQTRRAGGSETAARAPAKLVGGSTITQQLAKNLLLSGERTVLRKAQEALLTLALEALLSKRRILEIYLNHVEWGEGVFGAQAAAQHYFRVDAARLTPEQAARLAVMLPAPKRFERRPHSAYVAGRAATIVARMGAVELP
jgi:monofunctional biosynthetic peptidoglycan transglycosylase